MSENQISKPVIEAVSLANYLAITRKAGLPDSLAEQTYKENKESADKLTEFQLKHDIERGKQAQKLADIGHNSGDKQEVDDVGGVSGKRLNMFFDRIERLEEEKSNLAEDIKEVYAELKAAGFEVKIARKIMRLKKMDVEKRREEDELTDLYMAAIGMV